jgi:hypothetical protein
MDLSILRAICTRYKDCAPEYHIEPIPERKEKNARESLKIPLSEQIAALIDFTVFGSASDALVAAESGLYWKNISDSTPHRLTWDQLRQRTPSEKKGFLSKSIEFDDGTKLELSGATKLSGNDNPVVLQLLNDLKEMAEGAEFHEQNSCLDSDDKLDLEQLNSGLIECEFCTNMLKPEVTYCKHCGIKLRG